jgi:hypothetical protein
LKFEKICCRAALKFDSIFVKCGPKRVKRDFHDDAGVALKEVGKLREDHHSITDLEALHPSSPTSCEREPQLERWSPQLSSTVFFATGEAPLRRKTKSVEQTLWNTRCNEIAASRKSIVMPSAITNHVENRRLLGAAAGTLALSPWERQHVHQCETCQGVFKVFVNQLLGLAPPPPKKDEPAA